MGELGYRRSSSSSLALAGLELARKRRRRQFTLLRAAFYTRLENSDDKQVSEKERMEEVCIVSYRNRRRGAEASPVTRIRRGRSGELNFRCISE